MAYTSFDPRQSIIDKIGINYSVHGDGELQSCVTVTDNYNSTVYIPMYFSEEVKSVSQPKMPLIEMRIVDTMYEPHDIGASTRKMESYIDFHIWVANTDNIDNKTFAKLIKDQLHNLIRTNQCSFDNITFINVESDKYFEETDGRQVIYHYVTTVYCLYYDLCS